LPASAYQARYKRAGDTRRLINPIYHERSKWPGRLKTRRPGRLKDLQLKIRLFKAFELPSDPDLKNTIIRVYLKNKLLLKNKRKYFQKIRKGAGHSRCPCYYLHQNKTGE
jgi:hypothetical protein